MIDIFRKLTIVHLRTLYPILLTRNIWSFFSLVFCSCKVCCKIVGHFDHKLKSWAKSGNLEGPITSCQLNLMQRKVHWPFQKKFKISTLLTWFLLSIKSLFHIFLFRLKVQSLKPPLILMFLALKSFASFTKFKLTSCRNLLSRTPRSSRWSSALTVSLSS